MSDPDRSDTEPTGCSAASDEGPDADGDEATVPNDAPPEDVDAGVSEPDTDDFLRWLPTLALGHRRRTEIVERSSSDGADFAAYACEGRPAASSGQPRIESAVKVQPPRSIIEALDVPRLAADSVAVPTRAAAPEPEAKTTTARPDAAANAVAARKTTAPPRPALRSPPPKTPVPDDGRDELILPTVTR